MLNSNETMLLHHHDCPWCSAHYACEETGCVRERTLECAGCAQANDDDRMEG